MTGSLQAQPSEPQWSASDARASLAAAGPQRALEVLEHSSRLAAIAEAMSLATLAALESHARDWADDLTAKGDLDAADVALSSVASEVAVALPMSPRTARARLAHAGHVLECLPRTWAALAAGELDAARVYRMVDGTVGLAPEVAGRVEELVLDRARGQTPMQVVRSVARARLIADPDPEAASDRARVRARCAVGVRPNSEPGLADLVVTGPTDLVAAAFARIDAAAAAALAAAREAGVPVADRPTPGAERSRIALAALAGEGDSAAELDGVSIELAVIAPMGTVLGVEGPSGDVPGDVPGVGPLPAPVVRALAGDARWRRWLTDPDTGVVSDVGRTAYRPPSALADLVRARDGTCRFPRCTLRAARCDLDHTVRYPDGPTAEGNLASLCRRHHREKHHGGWRVVQEGRGRLTWTGPLGRTITTTPDPPAPSPPVPATGTTFDVSAPADIAAADPP
ncbi:MAG: DUF222 domain-containing protein [Kineosporiaceae bacterium]